MTLKSDPGPKTSKINQKLIKWASQNQQKGKDSIPTEGFWTHFLLKKHYLRAQKIQHREKGKDDDPWYGFPPVPAWITPPFGASFWFHFSLKTFNKSMSFLIHFFIDFGIELGAQMPPRTFWKSFKNQLKICPTISYFFHRFEDGFRNGFCLIF